MRFKQIACLIACGSLALPALGVSVNLYVDSAPNVYGSPNWASWWTAAQSDVVNGTFVNLRTGTYPGTLRIDPYDEIVYSTGDLGKRLHWIYWVPGVTTDALQGKFQVKWVIDWEGTAWTYDWSANDWITDGPEAGWVQPGSWENYSSGVIGTFGFAWWATDGEAPPSDTGGNLYDETNQADIDALRNQVFQSQTYAVGYVRIREDANSPWQVSSLKVTLPDGGATLVMLGVGLCTMAACWRGRRTS